VKKSNKSAKGVSLATVRWMWQEFNDLVFEGKLLEPTFRITRARGYWAKCHCPDTSPVPKVSIYISGHKHRGDTDGALGDSLIHEMIHQWQFENGIRHDDNHDKTFLQWLPVIQEKTGIILTNSWSEE
jgi:hypothetical protein